MYTNKEYTIAELEAEYKKSRLDAVQNEAQSASNIIKDTGKKAN